MNFDGLTNENLNTVIHLIRGCSHDSPAVSYTSSQTLCTALAYDAEMRLDYTKGADRASAEAKTAEYSASFVYSGYTVMQAAARVYAAKDMWLLNHKALTKGMTVHDRKLPVAKQFDMDWVSLPQLDRLALKLTVDPGKDPTWQTVSLPDAKRILQGDFEPTVYRPARETANTLNLLEGRLVEIFKWGEPDTAWAATAGFTGDPKAVTVLGPTPNIAAVRAVVAYYFADVIAECKPLQTRTAYVYTMTDEELERVISAHRTGAKYGVNRLEYTKDKMLSNILAYELQIDRIFGQAGAKHTACGTDTKVAGRRIMYSDSSMERAVAKVYCHVVTGGTVELPKEQK